MDLGDDVFTRGRPHPMIDHRLRNERIVREAGDPEMAVILLDVVLGFGSHPDPGRGDGAGDRERATASQRETVARSRSWATSAARTAIHRISQQQTARLSLAGMLLRRATRKRCAWLTRSSEPRRSTMSTLFIAGHAIINVGLRSFAETIARAGAQVVQLEWQPPASGDRALGMQLAALVNHPRVEQANQTGICSVPGGAAGADRRSARPAKALPGMTRRMLLHAGPPIAFEQMCGPMQGAVFGAILYEGWASDVEGARKLAASGKIALRALPSSRRGRVRWRA